MVGSAASRDLTVEGNGGDAFDGTKDENGFGRNDVVSADGLRALDVAGSGSASSVLLDGSRVVRGSAGVKKESGEAVMSNHMSRNYAYMRPSMNWILSSEGSTHTDGLLPEYRCEGLGLCSRECLIL